MPNVRNGLKHDGVPTASGIYERPDHGNVRRITWAQTFPLASDLILILPSKPSHRTIRPMRVLRNIVAFLLLAAWPVITSHPLLEKWGLIHEIHEHGHPHAGESDHAHEHSTADHAFAHGSYLSGSRLLQGSKAFVCLFFLLVAALALSPLRFRPPEAATPSGPSPPGASPPRAGSTWQFTLRAASQPRAPSFFS